MHHQFGFQAFGQGQQACHVSSSILQQVRPKRAPQPQLRIRDHAPVHLCKQKLIGWKIYMIQEEKTKNVWFWASWATEPGMKLGF